MKNLFFTLPLFSFLLAGLGTHQSIFTMENDSRPLTLSGPDKETHRCLGRLLCTYKISTDEYIVLRNGLTKKKIDTSAYNAAYNKALTEAKNAYILFNSYTKIENIENQTFWLSQPSIEEAINAANEYKKQEQIIVKICKDMAAQLNKSDANQLSTSKKNKICETDHFFKRFAVSETLKYLYKFLQVIDERTYALATQNFAIMQQLETNKTISKYYYFYNEIAEKRSISELKDTGVTQFVSAIITNVVNQLTEKGDTYDSFLVKENIHNRSTCPTLSHSIALIAQIKSDNNMFGGSAPLTMPIPRVTEHKQNKVSMHITVPKKLPATTQQTNCKTVIAHVAPKTKCTIFKAIPTIVNVQKSQQLSPITSGTLLSPCFDDASCGTLQRPLFTSHSSTAPSTSLPFIERMKRDDANEIITTLNNKCSEGCNEQQPKQRRTRTSSPIMVASFDEVDATDEEAFTEDLLREEKEQEERSRTKSCPPKLNT